MSDDLGSEEVAVAEQFYSVQGEGRYRGKPSLFFRTAGCNYICGGISAVEEHEGGEFERQVEGMAQNMADEENDGEWVCDTIEEWMDGSQMTVEEIYEHWEEEGWTEHIDEGAHIILTGGEPMVQQDNLVDLLDYVEEQGHDPFVEVETNGSIYPDEEMREHVNQYNLSPKLTNAGMKKEFVYHPENMRRFNQLNEVPGKNADWKFVVNSTDDWQEIQEDYLDEFDIDNDNVYLMPAGQNDEDLGYSRADVAELVKEHDVNYTDRDQVVIWGEVTGV